MKVVLGGDLFAGGDLLLNPPSKDLIQVNDFFTADFRILNLENPISDNKEVEDKSTLYASSRALEYLKVFRIDGVNLANNHIQDKNETGMIETFKNLKNAGIKYCGAGESRLEARTPLILEKKSQKTAILGYCDFGRFYLKEVVLATENKAGVAPLRYEVILEDIQKVGEVDNIILFFHWGREHSWFSPKSDIDLVKRLLEHPRVDIIIGTHAHLSQGYIKHNGKYAFMGLGNFLFPNFYIKQPTQIYYPKEQPKEYDTIRRYHPVRKTTYKKWKLANRISLLVSLDTDNNKMKYIPVMQDDNCPKVSELQGIPKRLFLFWMFLLSQIYKSPNFIYSPLERVNAFIVSIVRMTPIAVFYIRQNGIRWFIKKCRDHIKKS